MRLTQWKRPYPTSLMPYTAAPLEQDFDYDDTADLIEAIARKGYLETESIGILSDVTVPTCDTTHYTNSYERKPRAPLPPRTPKQIELRRLEEESKELIAQRAAEQKRRDEEWQKEDDKTVAAWRKSEEKRFAELERQQRAQDEARAWVKANAHLQRPDWVLESKAKLLEIMQTMKEPMTFDALCTRLRVTETTLLGMMADLEVEGKIFALPSGGWEAL